MELTITQSGALYSLQHGGTKKYRRLPSRRLGDLIRALPTLTTPMEKLRTRWIAAKKAQFVSQDTGSQVADAFSEYRAAA
jgi:hypothetical protein